MELTSEFDVTAPIEEAWRTLTDLELIAPCMPGAKLSEIEGDEYRGSVKVKVGPITAQFKGVASFVERDAGAHRAVLRGEGRDTSGKGNASALITAQLEPTGAGTHVTITTDLSITGRVAQFGRGALADVSTKLLGQFVSCLETTVLAGGAADDPVDTVTASVGGPDPAPAEDAPMVTDPAEIAPASAAVAGPDPSGGLDAPTPGVAASEVGALGAPAPTPTPTAATAATSGDGTSATLSTGGPGVRTIDSAEPEPVDLLGAAGAPLAKRLAPAVLIVLLVLVLRQRIRRSLHRRPPA